MNNKDKLLIIGAGGHGRVVADIAIKMNKWKSIAFLDDDENIKESMGIQVIGKIVNVFDYINEYDIFVALGNNSLREKIQKKLEEAGASIPILIHPDTVISKWVQVEIGTVIMAGTVINCCTFIGKGCIVNTGSTIDHDCIIEDYVHICPGVNMAGSVKIGTNSWIGIGSVVTNNISICKDCIIGAGAVVVKDINKTGTYVGVPVSKIS